jgi:hypothetical protein
MLGDQHNHVSAVAGMLEAAGSFIWPNIMRYCRITALLAIGLVTGCGVETATPEDPPASPPA